MDRRGDGALTEAGPARTRHRRGAARMAISILLACLALYLVVLAALTLGQRKLLYFPYSRVAAPAAVGLAKAQVLHLQTEDGETLLAWFVAPSPGRPLILYFHGNSNGLADTGERFRDPRTNRVMRVWEDSSGGRHYVAEDED